MQQESANAVELSTISITKFGLTFICLDFAAANSVKILDIVFCHVEQEMDIEQLDFELQKIVIEKKDEFEKLVNAEQQDIVKNKNGK